jgi:uncharacterized protein HemX
MDYCGKRSPRPTGSQEMADVTKTLKDAAYVVVGLGVLGFQQAQVRRRELQEQLEEQRKQLQTQLTEARQQVGKLFTQIEERFQPVVDEIDGRLDELETRLPEQARGFVQQARAFSLATSSPPSWRRQAS